MLWGVGSHAWGALSSRLHCVFVILAAILYTTNSFDDLLSKFDLNDTEYIARLKTMITDCNYAYSGTIDASDCEKVEYLLDVHKMFTSREKVVVGEKMKPNKKSENWNVKKLDKDGSQYSKVFQEYIVPGRPFISSFEMTTEVVADDISNGLYDLCFEAKSNDVSHDTPLLQCVKGGSIDELLMPKFVANDYMIRLSSESSHWSPLLFTNHGIGDTDSPSELGPVIASGAAAAEGVPYDHAIVDLSRQWPALVLARQRAHIHKCPDDMHQLIWSPFSSGSNATIRVLNRKDDDSFGKALNSNASNLHYPVFQRDAFSIDKEVKFQDVRLSYGEYLFVPNSFYVGIRGDTEKSALLRSCFVDASNYKAFLSSLTLSSKVSVRQKGLLRRLRNLSAGDKAMDREPVDMSFKNYSIFPRPAPVLSKEETLSAVDEVAGDSSGKKSPKKKKKKASSASNFRTWQENTRWLSLVQALTIPLADVSIGEVGRRNVTLHVSTHFAPSAADKTYYGFNITVCKNSDISYVGSAVKLFENCILVHMKRGDVRVREVNPTWLDDVDRETGNPQFHLTVTDLEVSTDYRFRVSSFYDTESGPLSKWTTATTTHPIAPPSPVLSPRAANDDMSPMSVLLSFASPVDDGGLPILGFKIYARCKLKGMPWFLLQVAFAGTSKVLVKNLLSNASYEFKVVAFNAFGECETSPYFNNVTTYAYNYFLTEVRKSIIDNSNSNIHGKGLAVGFYESDTDVQAKEARQRERVISRVVTLNTNDQAIYVMDSPHFKRIGWLCHWSMNLTYNVISEAVWAQPPSANTFLLNEHDLIGRIAVVLRGETSIAHKAMTVQRAGALAMIVVDLGELCSRAFDQKCVPGSDKSLGMGFASVDIPEPWEDVRIPVIMLAGDGIEELFDAAHLEVGHLYKVIGAITVPGELGSSREEL